MPRLEVLARRLAAAAFATIFTATGSVAQAQTYPARPITLVVPLPPGGTTYIFSRWVA
jgi:tripartite-type tricarboxylate transporter receptor subunit TctC